MNLNDTMNDNSLELLNTKERSSSISLEDNENKTEQVNNITNTRKISKEHSLTDKTKKTNKRK